MSHNTERSGADAGGTIDVSSLAAAFAHAADPIMILDPGGQLLSLNYAAERAYRCDGEQVLGNSIKVLVPEDLHAETDDLLERCRNGEQIANIHARRRRLDGEEFPVLTSFSVVTDHDGSPVCITAMAKDVTELKKSADELRLSYGKLAHESRLVAMGEMVAGLAHELNQPLSAVANYCDAALSILRSMPGDNHELIEVIRSGYEQSQRAAEILRNMRGISARRRLPFAKEDLNELIAATSQFMKAEMRSKRIDFSLELAEPAPPVLIDKVEIQQVIINLLLNAVEAMDDADTAIRELTIRSKVSGDDLEVCICDSGPGIDPSISAKLYDPFVSTKPDGLGLGLWICQSIICAHQGRLWVGTAEKGGATACFSLPADQGDGK